MPGAKSAAHSASLLTWPSLSERKSSPIQFDCGCDRTAHYSVILEFDMPSYRTNEAQER